MDTSTTKTESTKYEKETMDAANNRDDVNTLDGHQIKVDGTGVVSVDYYLRDGQYVTIQGLPQGANYGLVEDGENYTSTTGTAKIAVPAVGEPGEEGYVAAKTYDDPTSGTIGANDIYTGFTNTREGMLPTGVISTAVGSAGIAAVGLVGVIFGVICVKKKKSEEE